MSTFESKQYSFCEMDVVIGGKIIAGLQGIEYGVNTEKSFLYGRGCKPHGIQHGNTEYEGELSVWQSELEALIRDAPKNDIMKLRFDIVVSYVPHDGGPIVVDTLQGCEFKSWKKGMNQGDKNMEVKLPFIFLGVKKTI
ncbi:MAG: hypothetical protein C4K58_06920 [Flavobacteriaceae bacterium]|nr:MAG: hypothetical protein C4K58_06920 [Flavobacteriaceae bacterium]